MAFTLQQLQELEDAIASGAESVTFNGRTIRYRADMDKLRREMQQELGVSSARRNRAIVNPVTGKGL